MVENISQSKMGLPDDENPRLRLETFTAGAIWEISNQQSRDVSSLRKHYPSLNWNNINIIIPKVEDISVPELIFLK